LETTEFDLRETVQIFWRRRLIILATFLIFAVAAFGYSASKTKMYHGTASVLLNKAEVTAGVFASQSQLVSPEQQDRDNETQIQVLQSRTVYARVLAKIPNAPRVKGIKSGSTNVLRVQVASPNPKLSKRAADAYAIAYIDLRREQSVQDLLAASSAVKAQVDDLQGQLNVLDKQITATPTNDPGLPVLKTNYQGLLNQLTVFQQRLDSLNADALVKNGGAVLIDSSVIPQLPFAPTPKKDAALAGLFGLLLGLGLAYLLDYLDDRVKTLDDVEAASGGVNVLGVVPKAPVAKGARLLISDLPATSSVAEAYHSLRTTIQFLDIEHPLRRILVTSASQGEGKTTTVTNLAIALARAEKRVVLVDCDLRRPNLHNVFGIDDTVGLTAVLTRTATLQEAIETVPGEPNLRILPAGVVPANPSELLSGERMRRLIEAISAECDILLLDTPPVLPVTDAVALSQRVDGCIVLAGSTATKRHLARMFRMLRQVNAPITGVVLNNAESEGFGYGYGYSYGYGYRADEAQARAEHNGEHKAKRGRKSRSEKIPSGR
jgi:non-specific protein-tyrosine kinase